MKICQPHWDKLKEAVRERNLFCFVSNDGAGAVEKIQAQLTPGEPERAGFDPLLNANFAIWNNALEMGGLYLMGCDESGNEYCPICEAVKHGAHNEGWWITNAADEQLEKARALGLLPNASVQ